MADKRYSLAEVVSFLTGEDPCPEFSESSDSEAMGECCEGLEGTVSGMESESCSQESDGGESYGGISNENVVEKCSRDETDTKTEVMKL